MSETSKPPRKPKNLASDDSIFFEDWQACLRSHYIYVIQAQDEVTEPSLRHVLQQTGLTEESLIDLRNEIMAEAGLLPREPATLTDPSDNTEPANDTHRTETFPDQGQEEAERVDYLSDDSDADGSGEYVGDDVDDEQGDMVEDVVHDGHDPAYDEAGPEDAPYDDAVDSDLAQDDSVPVDESDSPTDQAGVTDQDADDQDFLQGVQDEIGDADNDNPPPPTQQLSLF